MAKKRKTESIVTSLGSTFGEFIAEKKAKNLAESTIANYEQSVRLFMEHHNLDEKAPTSIITVNLIYDWIESLKDGGAKPTSINHYLRDLRAYLYWCMAHEYLDHFNIVLLAGQEEAPKLFTDEEIDLLLVKPRKADSFSEWRTWAIVNFVLATGCRASTVINVRLPDINFGSKVITLAHTKNKKAQYLPLSPMLEKNLYEYLRMWEFNDEAWLFPNVGDEQLTTNALRHSFSRYCKSRGVSSTNIHGLRHNFAKAWVQNGGDAFKLQKVLGHATLDMTKHYVRLFSDDLKEDYDKYSALDTRKKGSKRTQTIKRA